MKPLHLRLQEARVRFGLPWAVLERDYLLSWVLAGLSRVEVLRSSLVFKGGTALKKCYFGDYRFSEDLDFSGLETVPAGSALERAMQEACRAAVAALDEYAPVEIVCERYTERAPHPGGPEAFTVRARFPWPRSPQTRAMVEITMDEDVLRPPETRRVLHDYGEPLHAEVQVYALEEIVAEKLRAILQHAARLAEHGWSRSRARDYYDLWRILKAYGGQVSRSGFLPLLRQKCAVRNVMFVGADDFFQEPILTHVRGTWQAWLGPLVPNLPEFTTSPGGTASLDQGTARGTGRLTREPVTPAWHPHQRSANPPGTDSRPGANGRVGTPIRAFVLQEWHQPRTAQAFVQPRGLTAQACPRVMRP